MMGDVVTRFLPERKAEFIRQQYDAIPAENTPLGVVVYAEAVVTPRGYVADACLHLRPGRIVDDNDLCADITAAASAAGMDGSAASAAGMDGSAASAAGMDGSAASAAGMGAVEAAGAAGMEVEDCCVLYCGYLHHDAWGHFITNSLARLWPIVRDGRRPDKYLFLSTQEVDVDCIRGNFAEVFRLLGIEGKIEILTRPKAFREVMVAELAYALDYKAYPEYVDLIAKIRERALAEGRQSSFKTAGAPVFLTRSGLKRAANSDFGIRIIDDFYRANGFDILYPERMGLVELICRLDRAPITATISGSAALNSIFCPVGAEVHIVERSATCNLFQPVIERAFDHTTVYVQGSHSLFPAAYGNGPFLYAVTRWLRAYARERGYTLPAVKSRDEARYFKAYRRRCLSAYRYRWWLDGWTAGQLDLFYEAYQEARTIYRDFIGGDGPFYQPRYKRLLRRLLGR